MTEPTRDHETLLVEHQPPVESMARRVAQRVGLADADRFVVWAMGRLRAHDHAILRQWRGQSRFQTFVAVVLANLAREFRHRR